MGRLTENSVVNIKNKSHAVTAEVVVPDGGAKGVIIAQGGSVRRLEPVRQGRQAEVLLQPPRAPALQRRGRRGDPAGRAPGARWSSPTTAAGWARAARSRSTSTATRSARAASTPPQPMIFSADETCDVGVESGTPVSDDYGPTRQRVHRRGELGPDRHRRRAEDADHLISAEERLRVAMARQ